ncbi:hypothetical protein [Butyrivibrio sp. AE3004]|uniref:hypothetical protein n=1 Tax=Butyrivibrio sp. AE3004 TaxID=1506994 RepID=UPI000494CDA8|nr:hypothetical protein [Butyrivibrio sp. AE3004]
MNDDFKYLSDEELNSLIESTEQSGLLEAPISFENEVLKRLENNLGNNVISIEEKKKEYSKFKFQVCMAMAAAILFLIVSPVLSVNDGIRTLREQATAIQNGKQTNYISDFLGNHVLSEKIGNGHIWLDKED